MKIISRPRRCWIFLLLAVGAVAHGQEHAQERPRRPEDIHKFPPAVAEEETYEYYWLLYKQLGCKSLKNLDEVFHEPRETVLIVLGGLDRFPANELAPFWKLGGALLLASGENDKGRLAFCEVAIDGMVVYQGAKGDKLYKGPDPDFDNRFLPWPDLRLHPFLDDPHLPCLRTRPFAPFEKMMGKERWGDMALATNGPSVLVRTGNPLGGEPLLEEIARFPNNCWTESSKDGKKQRIPYAVDVRPLPAKGKAAALKNIVRLEKAVYAMAAPAAEEGPIVVLAGERFFGDGMLQQGKIQNWEFAAKCAEFLLKDGRDRPRKHVLFMVDGKAMTQSSLFPDDIDPDLPLPPLPTITTKMVNSVLADLERRDILRQWLTDRMPGQTGMKLFLGVGSLLLFLYVGFRVSSGRWRIETRAPLVVDPQPEGGVDGQRKRSLLAERGESLEMLGNFAEPAQALARQWFWQNAGIDPVAWDEPGFRFPRWSIAGTWWQRWTLGRELQRLRSLAQDPGQSVSGGAFRKLPARLKELADLVGTEAISWPEPPAA